MIIRSLLVEQKTAVDMLVADDEIGELLVCQKRDARLREVRPKRPEDGRHKHEIAKMHEVDDKDVIVVFLLHRMIPFYCERRGRQASASPDLLWHFPNQRRCTASIHEAQTTKDLPICSHLHCPSTSRIFAWTSSTERIARQSSPLGHLLFQHALQVRGISMAFSCCP